MRLGNLIHLYLRTCRVEILVGLLDLHKFLLAARRGSELLWVSVGGRRLIPHFTAALFEDPHVHRLTEFVKTLLLGVQEARLGQTHSLPSPGASTANHAVSRQATLGGDHVVG